MKSILAYFQTTVVEFPDKVGFTDKERELTFSQAADSGKRLGTALAESGEKRPVAILIDRNCRCIEAMLGTLYAGDFYTVIDAHSPADRICHILDVLGDATLLTDQQTRSLAEQVRSTRTVVVPTLPDAAHIFDCAAGIHF